MFVASRVDEIITYVPTVCADCHTSLPIDPSPDDPEPGWHQVAELPEQAAIVTEHQAHWRTCPCCGLLNRATISPRSVPMRSGRDWRRT